MQAVVGSCSSSVGVTMIVVDDTTTNLIMRIFEYFDPLSKKDVNNLQSAFGQTNTSMAIMYIPMESVVGDPRPEIHAVW